MNIKELGNYKVVNDNNDSPILVGTPNFFNFSIQSKVAVDPAVTRPMFDAATQIEMKEDLLGLIYDAAETFGEVGDGCGSWWYLTEIKSEYINKIGVSDYFLVLSANVIVVSDDNFPATSPSGV
jgi:hypothetical protein